MRSFVNTTKIFCKLSGTLCQFNCLETLIFFKKLSTIRILFCSNDKCALSIILKNWYMWHMHHQGSQKIICIHNIFSNSEYHDYQGLGKSTYTAKTYKTSKKWYPLWLMALSNFLIRIEINRWYIVLLQIKMQSLYALRFMHHKSFPISFLSILTWLYWRKTFNKVF